MDSQTPTQEPTLYPQQHPNSFCERCKSIDFDAILSRQCDDGFKIAPLMNLEHLPLGDCALCQMFAQYRGDDWDGGVLCSIPWKRTIIHLSNGLEENLSRARMLCILPTGHIDDIDDIGGFFRQKGYISEPVDASLSWREGPAGPRSLDPGAIDYSMVRSWFDFCQDEHSLTSVCEPSNVDSEWPIRFIDCETRLVVEASSLGSLCPPFLALSYVWGQHVDLQYRQPAHDEPLQDVPLTVEDSIVVTQKLGFRYLWVDKYCVRQDDEGDKLLQVPLMADIYGSAQMTIIAGAGSDPSYGLPGVSRPRKIHQPQIRVGNHTLTWAWGSDSLREEIASSAWSTRGWTYQEAILSARRLVFTDQQVYLQCSRSSFYETLKIPFDLPAWTRTETIFPRMKKALVYDWDMGDRIYEYTHRKLGHEDDILNAFQGLFSAFSKKPMLVYNIWGIPIKAYYDRNKAEIRHPSHRFLASISWTLATPADRRHNFPSWSWAGWKGVVNSEYTDITCSIAGDDTDITVSFESPDGTRTEWPQLEPTLGAVGSRDHLRTLVLNCPSFQLQVEEAHDDGGSYGPASMGSSGLGAKTSLRAIGDVAGHFYPLCKRLSWGPNQPQQDRFIGVPMGLRAEWWPECELPRLFVLVVQKKGEFWERVGHFEWSNPEGETDFLTFLRTVRTTRTVLRIA